MFILARVLDCCVFRSKKKIIGYYVMCILIYKILQKYNFSESDFSCAVHY